MIRVEVHGPEHGGKGHLIALISDYLRSQGLSVAVQGEFTHLKEKFEQDTDYHVKKLTPHHIAITELQTAK